jgi:phage/plasmid-like protein (TIGR03299 family)
MGHELNFVNGKASMMYVQSEGMPWHGLGTPVDQALNSREAMIAAGLDNDVLQIPLTYTLPDGTVVETDRVANLRSDTHDLLGIVSKEYVPIQNYEAFSFLDGMVETGEVKYHTAGAFTRGGRVWMLARVPRDVVVKGVDVTQAYLLLYNSHDATSSLRVFWTPIRVVCWNTCSAALRNGEGSGVSIRHTGDVPSKLEEARRVLGLARDFYDQYEQAADVLASYQPTVAQVREYFGALFPEAGKDAETGKESFKGYGNTKSARDALLGLFEHGKGADMKEIRHTAWTAYNAVTEYLDHQTSRGATSRRIWMNWLGDGASVKRRAFQLALEMTRTPSSFDAFLQAAKAEPAAAPEPEPISVAVSTPAPKSRKKAAASVSAN